VRDCQHQPTTNNSKNYPKSTKPTLPPQLTALVDIIAGAFIGSKFVSGFARAAVGDGCVDALLLAASVVRLALVDVAVERLVRLIRAVNVLVA
jgi:hypothetical protein